MKKSIFLFFAAILCAVGVQASIKGYYIYFEKPSSWTATTTQFMVGHDNWSKGYKMTAITNTKLYQTKVTDDWNDYKNYAFINTSGESVWGDEGNPVSSRKTHAANSTNVFSTALKNYHLFSSSGSVSNSTTSYSSAVNKTQTIKVKVQNGESWADATVCLADLKASTYALTSATVAGAKSASLTKESATVSATVSAAYSATVTLSCKNVKEGYIFLGWYDSNGNKISNSSYTASSAATVYARFKKDVYYLAGTLVGAWVSNQQEMPKVSENIYEYTLTKPAGTYEFKVTDGTWNGKWDSYCIEGDYHDITGDDDKNIVLKLTEETTFTVRFNKSTNKVSFIGLKPSTYTIVGEGRPAFGEDWQVGNTDNDMELIDGLYTWSKKDVAMKNGTKLAFKVVKNHNWERGSWPAENKVINITKDGFYDLTITFNENNQEINYTATWTGEAPFKDFSNQPATLFLRPSAQWTTDNAIFAAYLYNEGFGADAEPVWKNLTDTDGDGAYECENTKEHEYVIFCRMNPAGIDPDNWKNKWNQVVTGISIPNEAGNVNNCCTFFSSTEWNIPTNDCSWVIPEILGSNDNQPLITKYDGATVNVIVDRSFKEGELHTLCLPFDLYASVIGTAYQLSDVKAQLSSMLKVETVECTTIQAGQPYLVVPTQDITGPIIVENVTIKEVDVTTVANTVANNGIRVSLQGILNGGGQTDGTTEYWIGNGGYLYYDVTNKLGLRAMFTITGMPAGMRARVVTSENAATDVENITNSENTTIKVIKNGQLIIIRNGEKFNAQGVRF